jgi:hypothetical protein
LRFRSDVFPLAARSPCPSDMKAREAYARQCWLSRGAW